VIARAPVGAHGLTLALRAKDSRFGRPGALMG